MHLDHLRNILGIPTREHPSDWQRVSLRKFKNQTITLHEVGMIQVQRRIRIVSEWVSSSLIEKNIRSLSLKNPIQMIV